MAETLRQKLERAYEMGFLESGQGYNGEWPFQDKGLDPRKDADWVARRDQSLTRVFGNPNGDKE